jgi:hypothetical protein
MSWNTNYIPLVTVKAMKILFMSLMIGVVMGVLIATTIGMGMIAFK